MFPATDDPEAKMVPAVSSLHGAPLVLEFDDLHDDRTSYYVKILHCNYDWTQSRLHDLDFLHDYNEYMINEYTYSSNTHVPYIHYQFLLPKVKLPGNYLLIVYRDGDKEDLMLSRRFMIYSNSVTVKQEANYGITTIKATNQQINFMLNYMALNIPNPLETVNVVIRQNQRWDNAQEDIKPSFIREQDKTMEYRFFNFDKSFRAGNEFRFVDFGSINSPGQNSARLERDKKPYKLFVATDAPRANQRYAQFRDLNGNYIIANYEGGNAEFTGNYLKVIFTLLAAQPYNSKVYVAGAFNDWKKAPENEMKFNQGEYTCELLIKQGFYNYGYLTEDPNESVEGDYYETENSYEIFVYNRSLFPDADMLVGYYPFRVNPR